MQRVITAEEREILEACTLFVKSGKKEMEIVTVDGKFPENDHFVIFSFDSPSIFLLGATLLHCAAAKGLTDCIE